ncbi:hypothetical protein [Nocardia anaemiae]|uniref:hypothetical protein n=1 Tax=Nocardia anaemiae TaxID=263910 RepID=UPI000B1757BE|nr:hypothetical protein [Nocardia anaemiae]
MSRSSSRLTVIAALALAGLVTAPVPAGADSTASSETTGFVEKYLGTWNYDQPDHVTRTNIATMDLFGYRPDIPQIGTITFTRGADGEVLGHTDQGCTWHFRPAGDALEMTSTTQYCFNNVIGSGYNIDRWRVTVDHGVERETLHANSYLGPGTFGFDLVDGRRTNAAAGTQADTAWRFSGTWTFDRAPFPINAATNSYFIPLPFTPAVMSGPVTFTPAADSTVTAHTADGCDWTFDAHGNTAELSPATQTCGATTLTFWSIANDVGHQTAVLAGQDHSTPFMMTSGSLTRKNWP